MPTAPLTEVSSNIRSLEASLLSRADEALALADQYAELADPTPTEIEALHFCRGVVAGLKYAVRRVREDEAGLTPDSTSA